MTITKNKDDQEILKKLILNDPEFLIEKIVLDRRLINLSHFS
jgi:hypothetical protein